MTTSTPTDAPAGSARRVLWGAAVAAVWVVAVAIHVVRPSDTWVAVAFISVQAGAAVFAWLGSRTAAPERRLPAQLVACGLARLGIGRGDRVGLFLPNVPHYVAAYYGALMAGAVVVNFSPLYTPAELEAQVEDSGTRLLFTLSARALLPADAAPGNGGFDFQVPEEGIEPILARLIDQGFGVAGLSVERPGLHEVFVKLVREAEA